MKISRELDFQSTKLLESAGLTGTKDKFCRSSFFLELVMLDQQILSAGQAWLCHPLQPVAEGWRETYITFKANPQVFLRQISGMLS